MGVNLKDLIQADSIRLEDLNRKTLAIDSFNILYQFLTGIRQRDGSLLQTSDGKISSHLYGLFYKFSRFYYEGIKPVFVFDGTPFRYKLEEIERRMEIKKESLQKALESELIEDRLKYMKRASFLDDFMIEESKKLIKFMGFPIIDAIHDAEAQAAYLTKTNECFAVVSEDYDSLLFGAKNTIRKFSTESKEFELLNLEKILKDLRINREQLILMGILIGLDFFEGVKGIGPKKALEIVKTYSKDQIFRKYGFDEKIDEIYNYLLNPPINMHYDISFSPPDEERY